MERSALVVGLSDEDFHRVAEALASAHCYADSIASGVEAIELVSLLPFDAIVSALPLPGDAFRELVRAVRTAESPCCRSAVVAVTTQAYLAKAREHLGRGVNKVLLADEPPERLARLLAGVILAAPRMSIRTTSRLLPCEHIRRVVICQTENISATGMLIRTELKPPLGSHILFELTLPGDPAPISGLAEVVRATTPLRERGSGIGVRFLLLDRGCAGRLARFLAERS